MADSGLVTAADVQLMQGLAQRVTAVRPDLANSDASFGEPAWTWGKGHACDGESRRRRLWFSGDELVAWGWACLPHRVRRSDGSVKDVTSAYLADQVHPDHSELVDEVIDWYDGVTVGIERTVVAQAADEFALKRWAAHGYETDPASLGDTGSWIQLNERDLDDVERPVLPDGFRFRTADEAGPRAAGQAHVDARAPSTYTAEGYEGVRRTPPYRGDLHVLVEAPDGTMAASTIMWLDEANKTAQFEPVGTHPDYRRLGLGPSMNGTCGSGDQLRTRHARTNCRPTPLVFPQGTSGGSPIGRSRSAGTRGGRRCSPRTPGMCDCHRSGRSFGCRRCAH
ncbi:GNAT family N-acetyltransferase [Streptomyces coacervatus]|uniref:GNAT family N-acetyltransferase n=1 Tax=Streptomyces coacervatus TaxID=647381 RepID=UPI0023DC1EBD|nr:GNAT family N-acetyltransferase [Streptomyces coacervatus]MDF2265149.1 GNAT family N-acetyltransferase [Streptomyces coacervatus]